MLLEGHSNEEVEAYVENVMKKRKASDPLVTKRDTGVQTT